MGFLAASVLFDPATGVTGLTDTGLALATGAGLDAFTVGAAGLVTGLLLATIPVFLGAALPLTTGAGLGLVTLVTLGAALVTEPDFGAFPPVTVGFAVGLEVATPFDAFVEAAGLTGAFFTGLAAGLALAVGWALAVGLALATGFGLATGFALATGLALATGFAFGAAFLATALFFTGLAGAFAAGLAAGLDLETEEAGFDTDLPLAGALGAAFFGAADLAVFPFTAAGLPDLTFF